MTIKELKQLSEEELKKFLQDLKEKKRELRFKSARREIKNVREIRNVKKTVARIMTLLKSKSSGLSKSLSKSNKSSS